jgi:hypothetical protein
MGKATEELQQVAQIRKAVAPLIDLVKREADTKMEERLSGIESALTALLKKDFTPEIKAPEVSVNMDIDQIVKAIEKQNNTLLAKSDTPVVTSQTYEPHDQAKSQAFQYSGFVNTSGEWYIQRVAKGEQRYAKGTGDYTTAWEKRSKLKFGYIDESN